MLTYLLQLFRDFRWQLVCALILIFASTLIEGFGILFFIPLIAISGLTGNVTNNTALQSHSLQHWLMQHHFNLTLEQSLFLFIFTLILSIVLNATHTLLISKIENQSTTQMRKKLYWNLLNARWSFLTSHHKGKLASLLTVETTRIGYMTKQMLLFYSALITTALYLSLSFIISWYSTLIVVLIGNLIFWLRIKQHGKAYHYGKKFQESWQKMQEHIHDFLSGIKLAKCFNSEHYHYTQFIDLNQTIENHESQFKYSNAKMHAVYQITTTIFLGIILYVVLNILHQRLLTILLLFFVFIRVLPKLLGLQQNYQTLKNLLPVYDVLQQMQMRAQRESEITHNDNIPITLDRYIALEQVSFAYDQQIILFDINLRIPAKSFTVIMGHSGAGKSTIADLLAGLILASTGTVVIDNIALDKNNHTSWRKNIAFVMQETFLFNTTIEDNLKLANPTAPIEEIMHALKLAQAHTFVAKLPLGLQTVIGDGSVRLSGGEQQRLALARAIIAKPQLLILDEVTSFLDQQNAQLILTTLLELKKTMTIVLITHQTAMTSQADCVITLEQGRLVRTHVTARTG